MSQTSTIKQNLGFLSNLPVGSIIAWHKSMDGTPTLPPGWAECNGQTLDDTDSPYHSKAIPDLNGQGRFLRGASDSGEPQPDQMQSHTHVDHGHWHFRNPDHDPELAWRNIPDGGGTKGVPSAEYDESYDLDRVEVGFADLSEPSPDDVRHGSETRPANMSVVWIIKIKQLTAAYPSRAYLAEEQAPGGTLYINRLGNVGIGTSTPAATLHVHGPLRVDGNRIRFGAFDGAGYSWIKAEGPEPESVFLGFKGTAEGVAEAVNISPGGTLGLYVTGGNVGIGTAEPNDKLEVYGDLRINTAVGDDDEIFFTDNGQIRSLDNNHRILFRRTENKMELREYGDLIFSPGATAGLETARVVMKANGNVGIGTTNPGAQLDIAEGMIVKGRKWGPVFRLWNNRSGDHFYTTSTTERDSAIRGGYTNEGIAFYAFR